MQVKRCATPGPSGSTSRRQRLLSLGLVRPLKKSLRGKRRGSGYSESSTLSTVPLTRGSTGGALVVDTLGLCVARERSKAGGARIPSFHAQHATAWVLRQRKVNDAEA